MAIDDVLADLDCIARSLAFATDANFVQAVAKKAAAEVRELRRVNALHEDICNRLHAIHTIDDDGRFCEGCEQFWPCLTMKVFLDHDLAAMAEAKERSDGE